MEMKAYVLIKIRSGEIQEVVRQLRKLTGVVEADMTFGPYDAIAILQTADTRHLGQVIANGIQPIPGVIETITCLAMEL
jgi:DNA-binding Lrp family transcriptional regulator